MAEIGTVRPVDIEEELKTSYLDYAMSVIISRALPDVRDGLKPVQRRILYAMDDMGIRPNSPHRKSARIVGEVLGKYHPHGDAPVYEAMVRMAQDFSMRYVLIDGQGNFGSIDDDPPAAMRYTEARLAPIATEMLADIDKETVDFVPNFDDTTKEPFVLPSRIPNLLINGSSGIAVGMATNIPPHNLGEVCTALSYLLQHPDATVDELLQYIPGPDFPTAAIIYTRDKEQQDLIRQAYATGNGRVVLRARSTTEETKKGRSQIVFTELPFQINKAALVEKIASLIKVKKLEGISELRDESDREGIRLVVEVKKEAQPQQVLNNLYKHTALQAGFAMNMLALVDGVPRVLSLRSLLLPFLDFRRQVITRRSRFELAKAKERAHILEGLTIALDNLDRVITVIRKSPTAEAARGALMAEFKLSQAQAQAILDMQLRRLAGLERSKVAEEYAEVTKTVARLEALLSDPKLIDQAIAEELREVAEKYGDPRRSEIRSEAPPEPGKEGYILHQEVVAVLTQRGYVKRLPAEVFRLQQRGGKGISGITIREEDEAQALLSADTHDSLFLFTKQGKAFGFKGYEAPEASRQSRGIPLVNLVGLDPADRVCATTVISHHQPKEFVVIATRKGKIKKVPARQFAFMRSRGLIAVLLPPGDEVAAVVEAGSEDQLLLLSAQGMALLLPATAVPSRSRKSGGVRGIRLKEQDRLVAMAVVPTDGNLIVIGSRGRGKFLSPTSLRVQGRGGYGLRVYKETPKTGTVVASLPLNPSQDLVVISKEGMVIRLSYEAIPVQRRTALGVKILDLEEGDGVVAIAGIKARGK